MKRPADTRWGALVLLGPLLLLGAFDREAQAEDRRAAFVLFVKDAHTDGPVAGAVISGADEAELARSGRDGKVVAALALAQTQIRIDHPSYRARSLRVSELASGGDPFLILLEPAAARPAKAVAQEPEETVAQEPEQIVVTARKRRVIAQVTALSGMELQDAMRSSMPATLARLPGFFAAYNGPAASRPSARGMSGDRLLILEDGFRTGGLYWSAADHGVMVEPLSAATIEVVRGAASLAYGADAIGGAVNVRRADIPGVLPDGVAVRLASHLESVNRQWAQAANVSAGAGDWAFRVEESTSRGGETRTPRGRLTGTSFRARGAAAGLAWHPVWGAAGVALRYYGNQYGVPGEFGGQLIPGGHPGGAWIETSRMLGRARVVLEPDAGALLRRVTVEGNLTQYEHDEIEARLLGRASFGARFRLRTTEARVLCEHGKTQGSNAGTWHGALGLLLLSQELQSGGTSPGNRGGSSVNFAAFAYEEVPVRALRIQAGVRWDLRASAPGWLDPIAVRTAQRRIHKEVSRRRFSGGSGSLSVLWPFADGFSVGTTVARSFRAPTLQEMYSDGPHLADFSFDIGSPDLRAEVGTGIDVFLRGTIQRLQLRGSLYASRVSGYVYYLATGETRRLIREGLRPVETPVYEARSAEAHILGGEGQLKWHFMPPLSAEVTASYTRAETATGDPLPFIPPLSGAASLRYEGAVVFASLELRTNAGQRRVPRPVSVGTRQLLPQLPTAGTTLIGAKAGLRLQRGGAEHMLTAELANATNRDWRSHLSRVKDIAPQPGRNLLLTYSLTF